LSTRTSGPEAWQNRLKEDKKREKDVKTKTTELHQQYRNTVLNEADVKLRVMKEEERRQHQETAEMLRNYKKLEMAEGEKKFSALKLEERKRLQETEQMLHSHQNNTIREEDMKLSVLRQEDRRRMQQNEEQWRSFQNNSVQVQKRGVRRVSSTLEIRPASSEEERPSNGDIKSVRKTMEAFSGLGRPRSRRASIGPCGHIQESNPSVATPPRSADDMTDASTHSSQRVDVAERPATPEHTISPIHAARRMFVNGTGGPLLPPKQNAYVSSASASSPGRNGAKSHVAENTAVKIPLETETDPVPVPVPEPVEEKEAEPEEPHEADEMLATEAATVVRLDVLFSFGLLTASDTPVFTNYMNSVEQIVKRTITNDEGLSRFVWYDPVYPPFVQDYTTDGK
jgi:hypothetical protein